MDMEIDKPDTDTHNNNNININDDNKDKAKANLGHSRYRNNPRIKWIEYLSRCLRERLDAKEFEAGLDALYRKHPLPPPIIADVFLRPQPSNHESLDPRIQRYLQSLTQRKLVDTPSILYALCRYSTSQVYMQHDDGARVRTWANSYTAEEIMFYRLSKAVRLKQGIKSTGEALHTCGVMSRWMNLFTAASAAFSQDVMGQLQNNQSRDEMEAARAAFVMLLLGFCESNYVPRALKQPDAKSS